MKHCFTFCKGGAVTVRIVRTLVAGLSLALLPGLALAQLTISSTSPAANARAATAAGPVAVTFNQAITNGSTAALKVFSAQRGGLRSVGSGTTSVSGSTVSFAPTYAFRPGEMVQATVTTAATATAGGATLAPARVLQFTAAAGGTGRGNFQPGTDVATAATPEVVAADFNNDGILDLADTGNGLSVRLGTGGGLYGTATTYAAANGSYFTLTAGDLDNDGDLDLVVPRTSGPIAVMRNNGSGSFTALADAPSIGTDPRKAALGDMNGDGNLDMLVPLSAGGGDVGLYLGNGNGSFVTPVSYVGASNSTYVALGDVDKDGDLDYVVSDYNNARVVVAINDGTGNILSLTNVAVNAQPNAVVLGDVNGDGALDILTANEGAAFLSVSLNTGTGSFAAFTQVAVPTRTAGLALGDVDADGDLDVVASSSGGGTGFYTCLNNGSGSFGSAVSTAGAGPVFYFSLADLDNDGDLDLAGGYPGTGALAIRLNQPPAPTLASLLPTSGLVGTSVTLTGTGFTGATGVSFSGTAAATFGATNSTTATATVPAGARPGLGTVTITTPSGTSNAVAFTVTLPASTISSFLPANGAAGTSVTISGTNLNYVTGVRFGMGALTTNFVSQSATSLTVRVPVAAATGVITLTNGAGAAVATATAFTYTPTAYVGQLLATLSPAGPLDGCQARTLTAAAVRQGVVTGAGFGSIVQTVVVQADGKVLVGGQFTSYNGTTGLNRLLRLNANGSADAGFATGTGFDNAVLSAALQADGKVLVGGNFTSYNGTAANSLIRLNANGSPDAGFVTGAGFDFGGSVRSVAVQADGKVLAGGQFNTYQGATAVNLIRLNADGSPDATFVTGTGFYGDVQSVVLQADGKVLVGGLFLDYNGTAVNKLIRLNADGSPDAGFATGTGFDNSVRSVAVQADGKVLVGGDFTSYNGTAASNLIRLNADGSPDAGFVTGAGFDNGVASVTVQADGKVLVGGGFTSYNGTAGQNRLVRLAANGSLDATFATGTGFNSDVLTVALQADGRVLAGGIFTTYQGAAALRFTPISADGSSNTLPTPVSGASFTFSPGNTTTNPLVTSAPGSYTAVARLGAETSAASNAVLLGACPTISGFAPATGPAGIPVTITGTNLNLVTGVRFGTGALTANFVSQSATSLTVRVPVVASTGVITLTNGAGTNVATATAFTYTPPAYAGQLLATLSPAGPLDGCAPRTLTATASRQGVGTGTGFNSNVNTVAVQADGKVLAGGNFTTYQGATANRLIRLNADGSLDATFATGVSFNGTVQSVAVQADGKVLVGGAFTTYQGAAANRLIRLNADGSPDAGFATGAGFNNVVNTVAVQADGKVLVGGFFNAYQGAGVNYLIRLNADGSPDATFVTGAGFNSIVQGVAVQADGKVLAGGFFTTYQGVGVNYLIRLNADGSPDASFVTAGGFGGQVYSVAVQADGKVLVGGNFTGYQTTTANRLARLNADGSPDAGFATGAGFNSTVNTVAVQVDGKVLVGGGFSTYQGATANFLTRLNADGSPDAGFATGTGFNNIVNSVALQADGRVLAGGSFTTYQGATASYFMALNANGSSNTAPTAVGGASFTFSPGNTTTNPLVTSTAGSYSVVASLGGDTSAPSNTVLLVACPAVSSFAPANGPAGTSVVITGTNLNLVTGVRFGTGMLTTNFVSQSATSLTVRVPVVASTGVITLTNATGSAVPTATAFTYTPRPAGLLAALSPAGPFDACQPRTLTATASSPAFATGAGFGGIVNTVVVQADGKVLVGGAFTTYQGATANRLIRLNADGSPDAGFVTGAGFNSGNVFSVAVQADGKVLVGGSFTSYQGATANRLIRLNADGSPDATFATGAGFSVAGSSVTSVAVQADGKVLVGGAFTTYQGATANRLIRLNADGSPDAGFVIGAGFNSTVNSLAVQADGKVLVGGLFVTYQGATARALIRLNADGSPDATFATGAGFNAGGSNVTSLAVQADGKVLAGGTFTLYQGATANRLIRLNTDGSPDAGFATGTGFNTTVTSVAVQADGKVLAGGLFGTYQGATANRLIRLNTNGSADAGFVTGSGFVGNVNSAALQADGQVLAGGTFGTYQGATANRLARLTATGSLNTTATAVSGATFTFSPGGTTTNPLVTSAAGSYTAVASLNGETSAASNAVVLTACPTPVISSLSVTSGPVGTSVTITGTNLAFASSVSFSGMAQPTISANTATSLTVAVPTGATTGNVTVTTNGGTSNGIAFTVTSAPTVTTATPASITSTSATLGGNATADGGTAVTERGVVYVAGTGTPTTADTKVVIGSGLGAFSQSVTGLTAATQYTVRAYAINTTDTGYGSAQTFTTAAALAASIASQTNVSCFGGSNGAATANATGGLTPYTYSWNTTPARTTATITGLPAGSYTVTVTDAASQTATATATITEPTALTTTGSQTNVSVSGGTDGTATVSVSGGTPGYTYNWSPGTPTGDGTPTISGLSAGTYSVLVTDANSCTTTRSYTITQPATVAPMLTTPANVTFINDPTPTYGGTGPAGSTIRVFVDGTSIGTTTATAGGSFSLTQPTALADGTHTVNATATAGTTTSLVSNTNGFTVDATAPTVSITSTAGNPTSTSPIPVTVTFSENVSGFVAGDVSVSNGALSNFAGIGSTYTFDVTPAANGAVTVSVAANVATDFAGNGNTAASFSTTYNLPDLTISTGTAGSPVVIAAGTYRNITVTGTGYAQVGGALVANGAFLVQGGLDTNCQALTGPGSFTLAAGATLGICDAAGISASGGSGAVQTTGTRSFSTDATYVYNGTTAQSTGTGLPASVRALTADNPVVVTLTQGVSIAQTLTLASTGNLLLNFNTLLLRSDATGTALVVNRSTGMVTGSTATMQRHIETNTAANGYRHYASPMQGETVNTLTTAGYAPNFAGAAAYNTSATPATVSPFPTVFGYNQDRIATTTSNYSTFDKGWQAALSGEAMTVGKGFSVQAPGAVLVDFTGTPVTGSVVVGGLARTNAADGWHLLGNPYPAPLDWSTMALGLGANLDGVDGAMYVFQSSGPYAGSYRTYLAAAPGGSSPLIPAGSGFFVRTTAPGTPGTVRFANANRVTTFGALPAFGRGNALRPTVALTLAGATGATDALTLYADPAATAGVDAAYDAVKLANPSGLNLAAVTATSELLAIDGRPAFTAGTAIALRLSVPTAGSYTLSATSVANLPAGLVAYLHDAATGQQVDLSRQPTTLVRLAAGLSTRYRVVFAAAGVLASAPALTAAQVALYPNPASQSASVRVTLPVAVGTRTAQATVLNALGQVVRSTRLTVQAGQASGTLSTEGLASGIYIVHLQAGAEVVSKRLTID